MSIPLAWLDQTMRRQQLCCLLFQPRPGGIFWMLTPCQAQALSPFSSATPGGNMF